MMSFQDEMKRLLQTKRASMTGGGQQYGTMSNGRGFFKNPDGSAQLAPQGYAPPAAPAPAAAAPAPAPAATPFQAEMQRQADTPPRPPRSVPYARGASVSPSYLMEGLQARGFNRAQSAALIGNMVEESRLRPTAINKDEGAHGLIQWRDDARGSRRFSNLQDFAQKQGKAWSDPDVQMDFIKHEMTNDPYERRMAQRFMNATTVEDANAGVRSYIRYGSPTQEARLGHAKRVLAGGDGAEPATSATALQPQQPSIANAPAQRAITAAAGAPQGAPRAQAAAPSAGGAGAQMASAVRGGGASQPSKLAQGIIAGYGPQGTGLSTYVEPATGNEILTGSVGDQSIFRNLGRPGESAMDSVRRAIGAPPKPAAAPGSPPQALPFAPHNEQRFRPAPEAGQGFPASAGDLLKAPDKLGAFPDANSYRIDPLNPVPIEQQRPLDVAKPSLPDVTGLFGAATGDGMLNTRAPLSPPQAFNKGGFGFTPRDGGPSIPSDLLFNPNAQARPPSLPLGPMTPGSTGEGLSVPSLMQQPQAPQAAPPMMSQPLQWWQWDNSPYAMGGFGAVPYGIGGIGGFDGGAGGGGMSAFSGIGFGGGG
jgi:hypothetical protein